MENLRSTLDEIIIYLKPYLPLANSHTVTFITENVWNKVVPDEIKLEVELLGVNEVLRRFWKNIDNDRTGSDGIAVLKFTNNAKLYTVEHSNIFLSLPELQTRLNKLITNNYKAVKLKGFMSAKKLHEVEVMCEIVSRIAAATNSSHIIDIGSGKGYISSVLALQHRFKVLGIDCNHINTHGATKRTIKFEKYWNALKKKSENPELHRNDKAGDVKEDRRKSVFKEQCSTYEEYYERYQFRSTILASLYKQRTENISEGTDLIKLISEEYPNDYYDSLSVIGLHTCGDLSAACLRLFARNEIVTSIISIGCCYHLIEEQFSTDPIWYRQQHAPTEPNENGDDSKSYGFPLSSFLLSKKFSLGRDARMCAAQFPQKIFKEQDLIEPTRPLFYRALLQQFLVKKFGHDEFARSAIGRLAHKCNSFPEYVRKALKRLDIDMQVEENELEKLQLDHTQDWEHLKVFFLLKTSLAPVIESVILMDRILYLYEAGINDAFVSQLFDPLLSPRCYAIIGIKNNPTLNLLK